MSDISELFARDPLSLTSTDISEMVDFYRRARVNFTLAGKASAADKVKPAKEKVNIDNLELDL